MKKLNILAITIVAIGQIFLIQYLILSFYPFKTLTVESPLKVLTPKVKAGDDMIYQVKYCRYTKVSAKVTRTLIGSDTIPTIPLNSISKPGCGTAVVHMNTPSSANPGIYHMEASADFQVNPYQIRTTNYESDNFEITK